MEIKETTINSEIIYDGKIIKVIKDTVTLPDGNTAIREVVEHPGGVCVLPIDSNRDVLLVEQFRYPYKEPTLEIPAGKRNSKTEEPLECGMRELSEETGAEAEKFTFLGELYPTPGYCGEIIYMYLATGLKFGKMHTDEDEFLNLKRIPFSKAIDLVMNGEIKDSKTQVAILKAKILLDKGELL
ncbi:MAG: NUDIX hydrolase [Clostridia bacterium]|nr:NUDIX hydrolase [Clostridia bacterium]